MSFKDELEKHVKLEYCQCQNHFEMPKENRCSICHKILLRQKKDKPLTNG
jgi:uncharacterized paraquat-inducible protein A